MVSYQCQKGGSRDFILCWKLGLALNVYIEFV